jgi:hypothetical protein
MSTNTLPSPILGLSACGKFKDQYDNAHFYGVVAKVDTNTITIKGSKRTRRGKNRIRFYSFPKSDVVVYLKHIEEVKMFEYKFRYTFKRKEDGHIFQLLTSISGIEREQGQLPSMLANDLWELIGRDLCTNREDHDGKDIFENDVVHYDQNEPPYVNEYTITRQPDGSFVGVPTMVKEGRNMPLTYMLDEGRTIVISNVHDHYTFPDQPHEL